MMVTHFILTVFLLGAFPVASPVSIKTNLITGKNFRVPILNYPPSFSVIKSPDGNLTPVGYSADILTWIGQRFDLTYTFVPIDQSESEKYGQVQAAINLLIKNEVNIIAFTLAIAHDRFRSVDFSMPVSVNQFGMMLPWPEEESKFVASFKPFQPQVWLYLFSSIVVLVTITSIIAHIDPNITNNPSLTENFGKHLIYVFSVMTGRSCQPPYNFRYFMLTGTWCLMMVIIVHSYTSTLKSYMTVSTLKPSISSFEDLIEHKDFKITVEKNQILTKTILGATGGTYKVMGDFLRNHPEFIFRENQFMQGMKNVLENDCVFPTALSSINILVGMDLKKYGYCRAAISKPLSFFQSYSFALPKDNTLNELINIALLQMNENGLPEYWGKKYTKGIHNFNKCKIQERKPVGEAKILTLQDISSAFILLSIGSVASIFAFALELMFNRIKRISKRKRQVDSI